MADWRGYIMVECLENLKAANFAVLLGAFDKLGPEKDERPSHLLQKRVSLDGAKAIYEARFDEDRISLDWVKTCLADLFGKSPEDVGHDVTAVSYSGKSSDTAIVALRYPVDGNAQVNFYRFGRGESWAVSHDEVLSYLSEHRKEWEGADV